MAVTAVFERPATGLVNPAAAQVADRVTFTLNDVVTTDTVITVTHNMNLSTADLAAGFPIVVLQPLRATARSASWVVGTVGTSAGRLANSIGMAKPVNCASDAGAGVAQIRVHLLRPHTIGR